MRYPHQPRAIAALALGVLLSAAVSTKTVAGQTRARDLYFEGDAPVAASGKAVATSAAGVARPAGVAAPATSGTIHRLGLRYNLLQVNPTTRESHAVDPDGNFSRGDCFAVEFSPNRDGHLYIFNRGSSGDWQVLLPSAAMPEEASLVRAGKMARVPQEYCFMVNDPPGVETLVVAVTERREDIDQLRQAMRGAGGADMKAVRNEVQQWQQQMGGRDLIMQKMDEPESAGEQPHTVYVAKTTAEESSRLVIEIKIRHEKN